MICAHSPLSSRMWPLLRGAPRAAQRRTVISCGQLRLADQTSRAHSAASSADKIKAASNAAAEPDYVRAQRESLAALKKRESDMAAGTHVVEAGQLDKYFPFAIGGVFATFFGW